MDCWSVGRSVGQTVARSVLPSSSRVGAEWRRTGVPEEMQQNARRAYVPVPSLADEVGLERTSVDSPGDTAATRVTPSGKATAQPLYGTDTESTDDGTVAPPPTSSFASSPFLVVLSILLSLFVVFFNVLSNYVVKIGENEVDYVQPGLFIFVNHAFMAWNLLLAQILFARRTNRGFLSCLCSLDLFRESLLEPSGWTWKQAIRKTTWLAFLYYTPNLAWAISLEYIAVPIAISTQQSNCAFIYLLGVYRKVMTASKGKSLACFVCVVGVALLGYGSVRGSNDVKSDTVADRAVWGMVFAIAYPATICFFNIGFKLDSKHCNSIERTCVMTGLIGVTNTLFLAPMILIQPLLGLGDVVLPHTLGQFGYLFLNGWVATGFNFCYMTGIAVMGPLLTSMALAMALPTSVILDYILKHGKSAMDPTSLCGAVLVFFAFLYMMTRNESRTSRRLSEQG